MYLQHRVPQALLRGVALTAALCALPSLAQAGTFVVTTTSFTAPGGLGAAVQNANLNPGSQIQFNLNPGDPNFDGFAYTIAVPTGSSVLITGAGTLLDGHSQTLY